VVAQNTNPDLCSGYSRSNGATYVHGLPDFSFRHTEPSQGQNSGSVWNIGTGEGQQYHQDPATAHNGSFQFNHNGMQDTHAMNTSQWRASPAHVESEQKPRLLSQQSTGAHDQEANHASSYDQSRSSRLYGAVSQGPNILSSGSDVTGRSSPVDSGLYTPHQLELQAFDGYPFSGMEELSGQTTFHGDSVSGLPHSSVSMTAGQPYSLFATADDTYASLPNGPSDLSSQMSQASLNLNSAIGCNSPAQLLWNDNIVSGSQRSADRGGPSPIRR
jgi:hypothetical protein